MAERWRASIIMYSAAVSVKMNVLLMAPAVLVLLLKAGWLCPRLSYIWHCCQTLHIRASIIVVYSGCLDHCSKVETVRGPSLHLIKAGTNSRVG